MSNTYQIVWWFLSTHNSSYHIMIVTTQKLKHFSNASVILSNDSLRGCLSADMYPTSTTFRLQTWMTANAKPWLVLQLHQYSSTYLTRNLINLLAISSILIFRLHWLIWLTAWIVSLFFDMEGLPFRSSSLWEIRPYLKVINRFVEHTNNFPYCCYIPRIISSDFSPSTYHCFRFFLGAVVQWDTHFKLTLKTPIYANDKTILPVNRRSNVMICSNEVSAASLGGRGRKISFSFLTSLVAHD